jgi:prevent-host-death family protein
VQRAQSTRDIQPVSEFRANAAKFIEQVRATRKPLIITQHGRGAAVLLDVESYDALMDELALRRAVEASDVRRRDGKPGLTTDEVMSELRARYDL